MLVWTSEALVGNGGGFEYLFESGIEGDPDYVLSERAYRLLGDQELADAFSAARKHALDSLGRLGAKRFYKLSKAERDNLDVQFYRAKVKLDDLAAAFVTKNGL